MKRWTTHKLLLCLLVLGQAPSDTWARGGIGGGRGGGGGGMRGGGGGRSGGGFQPSARPSAPSRPSSMPSFNRPAPSTRPSAPNVNRPNPTTRPGFPGGAGPSTGNRPGFPGGTPNTRPGGVNPGQGRPGAGNPGNVVNLPGTIGGNRPNLRPGDVGGNRPNIGNRPELGSRPGIGDRPNIGDRPSPGNRPGIGDRPNFGDRPNIGNRPGIGDRPNIGDRPGNGVRPDHRPGNNFPGIRPDQPIANLPGLGPDRRPGAGRPWDNYNPDRNVWINNRHNDLNVRFDQLNNHWGDRNYWNNRPDRVPDWRGWNNRYYNGWHGGWYHGYWPSPGQRWNYMWNRYPAAMAFGVTRWGLNSLTWAYGLGGYYNPYYVQPVYVNNQPIITYDQPLMPVTTAMATTAEANPDTPPPQMPATAEENFNQARVAFYELRFPEALDLTNKVLVEIPQDAVTNEFRSLCLFALGRYEESAATIHAVLAVGPGWDWTTMSSLYPSISVYTEQLRKLEAQVKAQPDNAAQRFLLAYHYLTCGHYESAVGQLKEVVRLEPRDTVAAQLLKINTAASQPETASEELPPGADLETPAIPLEKLYGVWKSTSDAGQFQLELNSQSEFVWTFTKDGKPQTMKGAYTVRGNNLAMEPDIGGVMLASIELDSAGNLTFAVIDDGPKLIFRK